MVGKTKGDEYFDPKFMISSDKMPCETNTPPVPPSDCKILQDMTKSDDQRKLQLSHSYHYSVDLFIDDGIHNRAKDKGAQNNDKVLKEYPTDSCNEYFAYVGEKTLYVYRTLDENKTGAIIQVQAVDIPNTPGFLKTFKIISNGFKSMMAQLGLVVDFLSYNMDFSYCIIG